MVAEVHVLVNAPSTNYAYGVPGASTCGCRARYCASRVATAGAAATNTTTTTVGGATSVATVAARPTS